MLVVVETGNSSIRALTDAGRNGITPHAVVPIEKAVYERERNLAGGDFSKDFLQIGDTHWVVGHEVSKLSMIAQTQIGTTRYTSDNGLYFKALVFRGVASIFDGVEGDKVQIDITLCVSHALNDLMYRDSIYETLVGKRGGEYNKNPKPVSHSFSAGDKKYIITIKRLYVFNEVAGGFHSFRMRFAPNDSSSTITYPFADRACAVVDVGHGTVQIATFDSNGRLNPNSKSIEYGMYNLISEYSDQLKSYLRSKHGIDLRITDSSFVMDSFKKGSVPVVGHGSIDVTEVRTRVMNNVRNQLRSAWVNNFNSGVGIEYVALTSGAAHLLYPFVGDLFDPHFKKNVVPKFSFVPRDEWDSLPSQYVFTASMLSEQYKSILPKMPSLTNAAGLLSLVYKVQWEANNGG